VPAVELDGLTQRAGRRELWRSLSLTVGRGELLAVLGPNGAGKTTLLRLILGLVRPTTGRVLVNGEAPASQRGRVGYLPQQRAFDRDLALRGRDLVALGVDGHRFGLRRGTTRQAVDEAIAAVEADDFADHPIGRLSGGEQQRLRIAQLLVQQPDLILADEPLLSLDLAQQQNVIARLADQRKAANTPVIFVTHDVNPLLPDVDRVLYLSGDGWAAGPVDEVLTGETLSRLYRTPIDVIRVRGRLVVVGTPETGAGHH
jgi:zinc/manganese transport system ATP-binding protein